MAMNVETPSASDQSADAPPSCDAQVIVGGSAGRICRVTHLAMRERFMGLHRALRRKEALRPLLAGDVEAKPLRKG